MFTNKVKIIVDNSTRLGAVATAFDGKASASGMMRLKPDADGKQVLYCKKFSKTQFLAALGHKKSQATIRDQASAAMTELATITDRSYGAGTAERIGLTAYGKVQADGTMNVLAGRVVDDLNLHAKVDKTLRDFGLAGDQDSVQERNAKTQQVKSEVRSQIADGSVHDVRRAVEKAAARFSVEDKPVYDAMDALDLLTDAPPAERRAALEAIKGFADEAMAANPGMPMSRARSVGAFRYAIQSFYEELKSSGTYEHALPPNLAEAAAARTNTLANSPKSFQSLDKTTLGFAKAALRKLGTADPVHLERMELEAALKGHNEREVLAEAIRNEIATAKPGDALRGNSALAAVMKERAVSDLKTTASDMLPKLTSGTLREEIKDLIPNATANKSQIARIAAEHLNRALDELQIDELPLRFCQDVSLGLEEIDKSNRFDEDEKAGIKMGFLVNQLFLRVLNPAIFDSAAKALKAGNVEENKILTTISVGLQKAVNDRATNAHYIEFMNKVAERGRLAT